MSEGEFVGTVPGVAVDDVVARLQLVHCALQGPLVVCGHLVTLDLQEGQGILADLLDWLILALDVIVDFLEEEEGRKRIPNGKPLKIDNFRVHNPGNSKNHPDCTLDNKKCSHLFL